MAKEPKRIGYELLTEELKTLIGGETGTSPIIDWSSILNKPTDYPPSIHTHTDLHTHINKDIIDNITAENIIQWNSVLTHNHNEIYLTETEINALLSGKSDIGHTHSGIAPLAHTHIEADVTNLDKYTKAEIDTKLLGKSESIHNHDGAYYKKTEVDSKLSNKAEKVHTHLKANISDFAHTHTVSDITNINIPTDTSHLTKSDVYTKVEVNDMMVVAGLGDMTKAIYDTDGDGTVNYADVANSVNWSGVQNKPITFPPDVHTHEQLHAHINKTVLDMIEEAFTTAMKEKLETLNNYIHPSGDGNLHVPSNGTTNSGKILKSTNVAGSIGWGNITPAEIGASPSSHMHTVAQITNFPSFSRLTLSTTQPTDGYWLKEV